MPHIETLKNQSLADPQVAAGHAVRSCETSFLSAMFAALRKAQHTNSRSPHQGELLGADLDLTVHPADISRMGLAFAEVRKSGYRAVQTVRFSRGAISGSFRPFSRVGNRDGRRWRFQFEDQKNGTGPGFGKEPAGTVLLLCFSGRMGSAKPRYCARYPAL